MGGRIVPAEYWGDFEPAWRNFFENTAAVQFHHRVLAVTTLTAVTAYWAGARGAALPPQVKRWANALLGMAGLQVRRRRGGPFISRRLGCIHFWCLGCLRQAAPVLSSALLQCRGGIPGDAWHHDAPLLRACGARGGAPGAATARLCSSIHRICRMRNPSVTSAPVPVCQAGALTLFSIVIALMHSLRRPRVAAQVAERVAAAAAGGAQKAQPAMAARGFAASAASQGPAKM